jgi:hypothetical protein
MCVVSLMSRPFYARERAPSTHWIGGCVDLRTGLDDMENRKFLILPELELGLLRSSSPQPVAEATTLSRLLLSRCRRLENFPPWRLLVSMVRFLGPRVLLVDPIRFCMILNYIMGTYIVVISPRRTSYYENNARHLLSVHASAFKRGALECINCWQLSSPIWLCG